MKKPETYAEYLKRVSGFADFTPLTLEGWERDTNPGTASLPSLSTKYPAKLHTPVLNITAQFIPAQQPPYEDEDDKRWLYNDATGQWDIPANKEYPVDTQDPTDNQDNRDHCLVCGTEVHPGPDFCSKECEKKAEELDKGEVGTVSAILTVTDLEPKDVPEGI
jgi:Uncharacterized protein containing a Zn-ribbon (DUF2116)